MAMASPTPMGSSHYASLRRPASRHNFKPSIQRPQLYRSDPVSSVAHVRTYSMNDSSDDEIPLPMMKFSALTNALLNDATPAVEVSLPHTAKTTPESTDGGFQFKAGGAGVNADKLSPVGTRVKSPHKRRVVRLSTTPGSSNMRRTSSGSNASRGQNEKSSEKAKVESPLDLSTPAQVPRKVRIPASTSGNHGASAGSSGKHSHRTDSASKNDEGEIEPQDYPSTVAKAQLATSQGSVSKYGPSTIGRTRFGENAGIQSSMRVKRIGTGNFLSGPARRGRRRMEDEEQSPVEEHGDGLDSAPSSQEPQSQESQAPESQNREAGSSEESKPNKASFYASSAYRDFASGSPISSKDALNSVLRSTTPPPPALASSQRIASSQAKAAPPAVQPVFKVPAPRPDLPSAHDQENEAPPTFKRNKQAPLIHLDKLEKVPVRPESVDLDILRASTPSKRRPLTLRSQNTPRRPAPPPPPPKMSILDAATSTAGAATASHAGGKRNKMKVNGKIYTRLDCIGRGGSSRVYRVMAENSKFFALKRVSLEDADESAVRGFKGEIDLLKKLEGVERVIRLWDFELNEEKSTLTVLMEMGELDMNKMLEMRLKSDNAKFDPSFVRHYWKEMLECLKAIHEHDIVHSDLKPHNFVLVQGRLKLIDFGIANAIQTDETVNVHRETQIGTPNYMSPESLMDSNAKPDSRGRIPNEPRLMKLGKPSDVWSLACILYQMVYGRAPFAHIPNQMHRCQAIINFNYEIEYPSLGVGSVPVPSSLIKTLKKCLNRDQFQRPSAEQLLSDRDPFLNPVDYDEALPITEDLLGRILASVMDRCSKQPPTNDQLTKIWPKAYFDRLRQKMAEGIEL
ncbi:hypothetical protein LZ554_007897 [Drepanopeziza brunnea f. sp. 'monogermtubi']|nr:hypothetical protein LZ554_007897 [Drepanopeziza brunnea f. sp. 'monogermtubi']